MKRSVAGIASLLDAVMSCQHNTTQLQHMLALRQASVPALLLPHSQAIVHWHAAAAAATAMACPYVTAHTGAQYVPWQQQWLQQIEYTPHMSQHSTCTG
jgi:hypothetical protein